MNILEKTWNSISEEVCSAYLDTVGNSSVSSRNLMIDIINQLMPKVGNQIIDIGCGNGNLYKYLFNSNNEIKYTGIDFSLGLINAAKKSYPAANFQIDDVITLKSITQKYSIAIYSHVIEMLSSPEQSLYNIAKACDAIVIRFFEPPDHEFDSVELLQLNLASGTQPYIRRKISRDYYRLMLAKIDAKIVHVYQDTHSNDQVHVIYLKNKGSK